MRKKVLIIAYAYEPGKTSEPGVGWHFTHEIAKFMDVTVLTRSNNKQAIEAVDDSFKIKYRYFDLPTFYTGIKKKIPLGIQLYFTLWQKAAYKEVESLGQHTKYDIIHHLTFGMTKIVPPAYKFDLPFIWGPIGGGDTIPFRFLKKMGIKAVVDELLYRFVHKMSDVSPFASRTRKKVAAIIFRTHSSMNHFPRSGCQNRRVISESAMPGINSLVLENKSMENFRILCVGRMIHGKGFDYALKGFYHFLKNNGKGKLVFLGEGPEEHKLRAFVKAKNITEAVEFRGFIPHNEVVEELKQSHLLLHPSFREGGSWAIMEAMSYGLPVVCFNVSGPKDMVSDTGILINLTHPKQVVEDISHALYKLYSNESLYRELSFKTMERIKLEYNWDKRGEQIKEVYQEILGNL